MAFKVRIEVGKGKNKSVSESIPLPNKKEFVILLREVLL